MGADLWHADFGVCWLWSPPAAAVPRESPPDLARLWHGELLIRSSSQNGQRRPHRPLRGPGETLADGAVAGVAVLGCCTAVPRVREVLTPALSSSQRTDTDRRFPTSSRSGTRVEQSQRGHSDTLRAGGKPARVGNRSTAPLHRPRVRGPAAGYVGEAKGFPSGTGGPPHRAPGTRTGAQSGPW